MAPDNTVLNDAHSVPVWAKLALVGTALMQAHDPAAACPDTVLDEVTYG